MGAFDHAEEDADLAALREEFGSRWQIDRARYADGWMFRARPFPPSWDGAWVLKADAPEIAEQLRAIEGSPA